jgi:hypothetical protein
LKKKYTNIINLTNHTIKELISSREFEVSKTGVARVETVQVPIYEDEDGGFKIFKTEYKDIVGLDVNNIDTNTLYIVSAVVLNALLYKGLHFDNIVAPKESIRDNNGNVIGAKNFRVNG